MVMTYRNKKVSLFYYFLCFSLFFYYYLPFLFFRDHLNNDFGDFGVMIAILDGNGIWKQKGEFSLLFLLFFFFYFFFLFFIMTYCFFFFETVNSTRLVDST